MNEVARVTGAVAALPALPPDRTAGEPDRPDRPDHQNADRYGIRRLTVTWLSGLSPHTRTAYFRDLAHYLAWCQRDGLDPRAARPADLDQYRAGLAPAAPATVHRRLSALSSWYRYLVGNASGEVSTNPVTGIRRPRVDRDASTTAGLTADEVRALLRRADALAERRTSELRRGATPYRRARYLAGLRDRALLRLLADLGLRIGEALALDVAALSYNQGRRTLRYLGKGGKQRERPLAPHALAAIDDYLAARAQLSGVPVGQLTGALFATAGRSGDSGGPAGPASPAGPGRFTEPAAFRLVRRLARQAGLPGADRLSPHSLRHAFATNARELGVPLEDVQDAMGHADARTTRRYDRGRYALHRDPALRLGDLYADRAG